MATTWFKEVDFIPVQDRVMSRGDTGGDVATMQQHLKNAGFHTAVDGIFGGGMERTVVEFQRTNNLVADGRIGPKTQWLLETQEPDPRVLSQKDLQRAADELVVPLPAIMAVNEIESRGSGFFDPKHPAILFERHVMYRQLNKNHPPASRWVSTNPNVVNTSTGGYSGGLSEYDRLNEAMLIDGPSAYESASWGAFQIMGYHWSALGYANVAEFIDLMYLSEANHLDAFVLFIKNDTKLWDALRQQDWAEFARRYNGPGYAKNQYDQKLAVAYDRYHSIHVA